MGNDVVADQQCQGLAEVEGARCFQCLGQRLAESQVLNERAGAEVDGKDFYLQTVAQHQCVLPVVEVNREPSRSAAKLLAITLADASD